MIGASPASRRHRAIEAKARSTPPVVVPGIEIRELYA